MHYAIEAEGLVKRFGATLALDGVSFAVETGTVLGVLGPDGVGRTTAVRILATLLAGRGPLHPHRAHRDRRRPPGGGMNSQATATVAGVLPVIARAPRRRWPLRASSDCSCAPLSSTRPPPLSTSREPRMATRTPISPTP